MSNTKFHEYIRQLITQDELNAALQQLRTFLQNTPKFKETILQTARFKDISRQIRLGTVSHKEANLTKNQIRVGLLNLLDEIETQSQQPTFQQEMQQAISIVQSKNIVTGSIRTGDNSKVTIGDTHNTTESEISRLLKLFLYFFVPIISIVGACFWYQYQQMQIPIDLKVRIKNTTPNPELPEPSGTLNLTYGKKTEFKKQDRKAMTFENIPANFYNKKVQLTYAAKGFVPVDTIFILNMDALTLMVQRNDDLATIKGRIKDEEGKTLEGVKVSIPCCSTLTKADGIFLLAVSFKYQRTQQRIDLYKAGYQDKSITTPVYKNEMIRTVLEKL